MDEYKIDGASLHCGCGRKYHMSLFHERLRVIATEAFKRGASTPEEQIEASIQAGYASSHAAEASR